MPGAVLRSLFLHGVLHESACVQRVPALICCRDMSACARVHDARARTQVYADGRVDSAGEGKLTSTTVEYLFKTDSKIPEEACKKKTPPCTSIDAAIKKCAGKDYGSKYSSTVESADTFGNVADGGVRCWQGSSCH